MTAAPPSTGAPGAGVRWTADLVASLDWKRLVELTRALSAAAGFELGPTKVAADAGAEFGLVRGTGVATQRMVVRLTPWNRWMAPAEPLVRFAEELAVFKHIRGVFIAPGGFTPAARREARNSGIETVDAQTLTRRLNELPAEHSEFFHQAAVAGDPTEPSCPLCLQRMKMINDATARTAAVDGLPDVSYFESDIVAEPVLARRIEVTAGCEVQFLHVVRSRELVVHGVVTGEFLCEGAVTLQPSSKLYGSVAARSVKVSPGAELLGETRIVNGIPAPFARTAPAWIWRCTNPKGTPGCENITLMPHE